MSKLTQLLQHVCEPQHEQFLITLHESLFGITQQDIESQLITISPERYHLFRKDRDKIKVIQQVVCQYFDLRDYELKAETRVHKVVFARQVVLAAQYSCTKYSLAEVSRMFGKHHATVLYSISQVRNLYATSKPHRDDIQAIINKLNSEMIEGFEILFTNDYKDSLKKV